MNDQIQFSFSLGSNNTVATASIPGGVSDGNWHSVTVSYFNKVSVEGYPVISFYSCLNPQLNVLLLKATTKSLQK